MKTIERVLALILTISLFSGLSAGAWAETLSLPKSLQIIEEEAFAGDSSLDEMIIPEGTSRIDRRAFADSSLRTVSLPASLTEIANDAFEDSSPAATAVSGSYAWRWAAAHGLIKNLAFADSSDYDCSFIRAVFQDNKQIGLTHNSWLRHYEIANYDELKEKYGGEPAWKVEFVGESYGARLSYNVDSGQGRGAAAIGVMIDDEPQLPCSMQYRVTCTWKDESISSLGTIEYREMPLPTAIIAEDRYRMKINETYLLSASVSPENLSYQNEAYCSVTTGMKCDKYHDTQYGDSVCCFCPREAGSFAGTLYVRFGNIQISKSILLLVADESGKVPPAVMGLHTDYAFSMFTATGESANYIVRLTDLTRAIAPDNAGTMEQLYGDDYTWTFEPMGETELEISAIKENSAFRFKVENYAQVPEGNVNVKAMLRWGDTTAMTFLHFRFGVLPIPEKINFEEHISMRPGETYEVTASIEDPDWNYSWILYYNISDSSRKSMSWSDLSVNRNSYYLRAWEEGLYAMRPMLVVGDNAQICGDWCLASVFNDPSDWHVQEGSVTESARQQIAEPRFNELTVNRLTIEGIPLYEVFRDDGQKKPLVIFLHGGAGGNKENNIRKAARLALEGMYAVAIDCAGCGDSALGPIDAISCWRMTIAQIDKLIEYYRSTGSQADASNFGLYGKSMGANISYGYVVHGKYDPTVIVVENGTPDYLTLKEAGPLHGAFDHGAAGHQYAQMSEQEVNVIADRIAPIYQPETFLNVAVYVGSWTNDRYAPLSGNQALKSYLDAQGGTKHTFKFYEGDFHGEAFPEDFDFIAAFRQYLLNE